MQEFKINYDNVTNNYNNIFDSLKQFFKTANNKTHKLIVIYLLDLLHNINIFTK